MNNDKTERAILSCILKQGDLINEVAEKGILPRDFKDPEARSILQAIMTEAGNGNDPIYETMMVHEGINFGALNAIDELVETPMIFGTVLDRFVTEKKKTRMIRLLAELKEGIERDTLGEDDVISQINDSSQFSFSQSKTVCLKDSIDDLLKKSDQNPEELEKNLRRYPHAFSKMDQEFGEIRQSEYMVIGARPSTGKTSLAMQTAVQNAKKGYNVLFFSFETDPEELGEILMLQQTKFNFDRIVSDSNAKMAWKDCAGNDFLSRLHIVSTPCTVEAIEGKTRAFHAVGKCDMIIIDYLQLIIATNSKDFREQQLAHISRRLRLMTIDLKIPVIALAQLNRESEKNDRSPKLSDLRESGSIEQDASRVVMIHRGKERFDGTTQDPEQGFTGTDYHTALMQKKCKKGKKDVNLRTVFVGMEQTFYEYTEI